jgi:hypothetical protein
VCGLGGHNINDKEPWAQAGKQLIALAITLGIALIGGEYK